MTAFVKPLSGQRGAALVVGLIMLLLLTLLGVAGMRDTLLQERMVGSTRDRDLALQAAEAALRAAEASLGSGDDVIPAMTGTGKSSLTGADMQRNEGDHWRNSANWAGAATYSGLAPGVVLTAPKFMIEELPETYSMLSGTCNDNVDGNDAAVCTAGKQKVHDYKITARGTGLTDDAVVILQSVYRRIEQF